MTEPGRCFRREDLLDRDWPLAGRSSPGLFRLQISAQREATRAQLAAHRIHIDNERLKLARQKQAHHEQLHQPKSDWNQDEAAQKVEAIMTYCRESLRPENQRTKSFVPRADSAITPSNDDNQRSGMTAMNSETTQN